jgi:hypothetical protein
MTPALKAVALGLYATLAAGCSGAPRTAGPAPQTLAAASGAAPAATTPSAVAPTAPASDVDASLVRAGYSVLKRHGQVFYCRNETITGNRIATRVCLTAAQIQDEKHEVTKAKDMLNQPSYQCMGASCKN